MSGDSNQQSVRDDGRCPSCGLSPYERGIGDSDISRILAERNSLIEQYAARTRDFMAAVDRNEEKDRKLADLQEQFEILHATLREINSFISERHKQGDTDYQAALLARSALRRVSSPASEPKEEK